MKIRIFLFHRISPERDPLWDPISPQRFDAIIRSIMKKYKVVPLERTLLSKDTTPPGEPMAAIVFDDGYRDFLIHALPVLQKYDCPSSIYLVTDCVTKQLPPWTYILDHHFLHSKRLSLDLDADLLPEKLKNTRFNDQRSKLEFASAFKLHLKRIPDRERTALFSQAIGSLNDTEIPKDLMLNWNEVKSVAGEGVEVGSHSVSHPLLAQLESDEELEYQLKESGRVIQDHLGFFPATISYPIGSFNEKVKSFAKKCGYRIGLAVEQQFYDSTVHDDFEIPRVELYSQSMLKTNLRISGITSIFNNWFRR